ncbi:hypothetical protein OAL90_00365 [Hyphomicrobiales bacterium]|nr:hypothetical protein [Hyphomicrobiales bacterium]
MYYMKQMLSQIKNIFFVTDDIEKSSKEFSLFFSKEAYFKGFSNQLGVEIQIFSIGNLSINIISSFCEGLWSEKILNFKKKRKEGLFGLELMSDGIINDYENLKKIEIPVGEIEKITIQDLKDKIYTHNSFSIDESLVSNLNIMVSDNTNFSIEEENHDPNTNIESINQVVIKTNNPDGIVNLFEKNLEIRLALDKTFKEWSGRMLFFRIGGVTLEVVEEEGLNNLNEYYGIGWHSDNFTECYEDLTQKGFSFSEIRKGRKPGTLVSTLNDPILGIPAILIGLDGEIS